MRRDAGRDARVKKRCENIEEEVGRGNWGGVSQDGAMEGGGRERRNVGRDGMRVMLRCENTELGTEKLQSWNRELGLSDTGKGQGMD